MSTTKVEVTKTTVAVSAGSAAVTAAAMLLILGGGSDGSQGRDNLLAAAEEVYELGDYETISKVDDSTYVLMYTDIDTTNGYSGGTEFVETFEGDVALDAFLNETILSSQSVVDRQQRVIDDANNILNR